MKKLLALSIFILTINVFGEDKKEEFIDAVVPFTTTSSKNNINKSCSSTCSYKKLKYKNDYKIKPKSQCKCG